MKVANRHLWIENKTSILSLRNREIVIFTHCIDSESVWLQVGLCTNHNVQLCSLHSHVDQKEEEEEG